MYGHQTYLSLIGDYGLAGHVPPSLELSETRSVLCHSVVVDSTFKQSENVAIAVMNFEQLLLTCIEGYGLQSNRFKVMLLHVHCTNS